MSEPMHYNIYCDESRHTSDPLDTYMVIGAISCPREHKREVVHAIHKLKAKYSAQGEFGWKRLSPNRETFYLELLQLFARDEQLQFRALVANRRTLEHESNNGDKELGFYKHYYQMLVHWLKPGSAYHIYLDWQQNSAQYRFSDLRFYLERKLSGRARMECLEPITSHNQPLIELTDLLIGAIGYAWNGRSGSAVKVNFCNEFAKVAGLLNLSVSTGPDRQKVNIFNFAGR